MANDDYDAAPRPRKDDGGRTATTTPSSSTNTTTTSSTKGGRTGVIKLRLGGGASSHESSDDAVAAASVRAWHQSTALSLSYVDGAWSYGGETTLWCTTTTTTTTDDGAGTILRASLHARTPLVVEGVEAHGVGRVAATETEETKNDDETTTTRRDADATRQSTETIDDASAFSVVPLRDVSYAHHDPLAKVFRRSVRGVARDHERRSGDRGRRRGPLFEADAHCYKGGRRFAGALRAAGAASRAGELRVRARISSDVPDEAERARLWRSDLALDDADAAADGALLTRLRRDANGAEPARRRRRTALVAERLAAAGARATRLTIRFRISRPEASSTATGLTFVAGPTPFAYTSSGRVGDHEGPRRWLPCADSAAAGHRCSHELSVIVTARREEGLVAVGATEDGFGRSDVVVAPPTDDVRVVRDDDDDGARASGTRHVARLPRRARRGDALLASHVFVGVAFSPVPARSLGFVAAPLTAARDPERPDDARQMVVTPRARRRRTHSSVPSPLPPAMAEAVAAGTAGVALRALSLVREVAAAPCAAASGHTQAWLPGAGTTAADATAATATNAWLGGATSDARTLPPLRRRLPHHAGGRALQTAQARAAIAGWITARVPLGGDDDAGHAYAHALLAACLTDIYLRAHGGSGEGGGRTSHYYCPRHAAGDDRALDFLPVRNVEREELHGDGAAAVLGAAVEEKGSEELWRGPANGTESRTTARDEQAVRRVLAADCLEALERTDDRPSTDWSGSRNSLTYLSSNACSSSAVGCGVTDAVHPVGGPLYRWLKCEVLSQAVAARAGLPNLVRLLRACFLATMLLDKGEEGLVLPELHATADKDSKNDDDKKDKPGDSNKDAEKKPDDPPPPAAAAAPPRIRPPFVVCVDEIVKKGGLTHALFTSSLRRLAGLLREPYLHGHNDWSLTDPSPEIKDSKHRPLAEPEGFPNSYVRSSSLLYLRVGAHVEVAGAPGGGGAAAADAAAHGGVRLHVYAEPAIPAGSVAFEGPVTLRVVENEGQCCEYERRLTGDGRREQWGPIFLHAKTVTTAKKQNNASGVIDGGVVVGGDAGDDGHVKATGCFNEHMLHRMGYQALELIRLTNRTPLLWVRVDPHDMYPAARIVVSQPDACLAEQLFHDGDAGAQIAAVRALAERPARIQGSVRVTRLHDAAVDELPCRVLGDCLRGTRALHCALPHAPVVRAAAALAIAQWQNNKAPASKDAVGADSWLGLETLLQYFRERHESGGGDRRRNDDGGSGGGEILPPRYTRLSVRKADAKSGGGDAGGSGTAADHYAYLDSLDDDERAALEDSLAVEDVAVEEDEEYRVRSAVVTAIASIRAKDDQTPPAVLRFLERLLSAGDGAALENASSKEDEAALPPAKRARLDGRGGGGGGGTGADKGGTGGGGGGTGADGDESDDEEDVVVQHQAMDKQYVTAQVTADALLALCHVNCRPAVILDSVGRPVQVHGDHPVQKILDLCHRALDWELYKETIRMQAEAKVMSGIGGNCYACVAACAVTALSQLVILKNCTTDSPYSSESGGPRTERTNSVAEGEDDPAERELREISSAAETTTTTTATASDKAADPSSAVFYADIFDETPRRCDEVRAAAAQALVCVCCAADRLKKKKSEMFGLLASLEFLLDRILDPTNSPALRQTLVAVMMDACSGRACSTQRVASMAGRNDPAPALARFLCGPLGASAGGDNGSALLLSANETTNPAAHAVNHGAYEGCRLLRAGRNPHSYSDAAIVRVARFATKLWRTMNGELGGVVPNDQDEDDEDGGAQRARRKRGLVYAEANGVCAYDDYLRVSLLAFWQKIWPEECDAIHQVRTWREERGVSIDDDVLEISLEEAKEINNAERELGDFHNIVEAELKRQEWRGKMAEKAFEYWKSDGERGAKDMVGSANEGVGHPLPVVEKDKAWKMGGWVSSAAQQRRKKSAESKTSIKLNVRAKMKD